MASFYEHFPELLLFDGSYKLNNRDMPLFTQLCVDGNGETEIISLFVCVSESGLAIGSMIDVFKETNKSWSKTLVIVGDKDFADRMVYKEKFPDAELQICLWHVLIAFKREITPVKRNITKSQRDEVLEILELLVYSRSAEEYDNLYKKLMDLELDEVSQYFNVNWHNIRNEWTLYERNQHSNYLNTTNNRSESLNRNFKSISCRYANLAIFFENLLITISVLASEKNIRAVRSTMKRTRMVINDPCLLQ